MFSATLGLVDIVKGTNSYYKLQLLEDDRESRCVWGWGRVPRGGPVREWACEGCGEVFGQREDTGTPHSLAPFHPAPQLPRTRCPAISRDTLSTAP